VSVDGGVVSAANTGPASNNRLRTGTSFLNIECLQGRLSVSNDTGGHDTR
jgi:hypothetical protein